MKSNNEVNSTQEDGKADDYRIYFEVQLEEQDFGKGRPNHDAICNPILLPYLEELSADGMELCETVNNAELIKAIIENPQEPLHKSLTWHHCHSTTVGTPGVMQLVLDAEHRNPEFSHLFHPDQEGGYHEWAVPRGAPVKKSRGYPSNVRETAIPTLPRDKLAPALLTTIATNNHKKFNLVLERAKELKLSEDELTTLVTQNYEVGLSKRQANLLHLATEHGNPELIEPLLIYFTRLPNFSRLVDVKGNTPAHIASERKRERALQKLIIEGIDLTIKNKKNQTAYDIAQEKNHTTCMAFCAFNTGEDSTQVTTREERQERLAKIALNFEFLYGNKPNHSSLASTLNVSSTPIPQAFKKQSSMHQIKHSQEAPTVKPVIPDMAERLKKMTFMERVEWEKRVTRGAAIREQQAAAERIAERKREFAAKVAARQAELYPKASDQSISIPKNTQPETSTPVQNKPKLPIVIPDTEKLRQIEAPRKADLMKQRLQALRQRALLHQQELNKQNTQQLINQSQKTVSSESDKQNVSKFAPQRFFQPFPAASAVQQPASTQKTLISNTIAPTAPQAASHPAVKQNTSVSLPSSTPKSVPQKIAPNNNTAQQSQNQQREQQNQAQQQQRQLEAQLQKQLAAQAQQQQRQQQVQQLQRQQQNQAQQQQRQLQTQQQQRQLAAQSQQQQRQQQAQQQQRQQQNQAQQQQRQLQTQQQQRQLVAQSQQQQRQQQVQQLQRQQQNQTQLQRQQQLQQQQKQQQLQQQQRLQQQRQQQLQQQQRQQQLQQQQRLQQQRQQQLQQQQRQQQLLQQQRLQQQRQQQLQQQQAQQRAQQQAAQAAAAKRAAEETAARQRAQEQAARAAAERAAAQRAAQQAAAQRVAQQAAAQRAAQQAAAQRASSRRY